MRHRATRASPRASSTCPCSCSARSAWPTLGTIATDHTKALSAAGHPLIGALTGGYHLAYLVAAVCVGLGVLATFVLLRPPAATVQEIDAEERVEAAREGELVAA